jgi:hypothetical protein
LTGSVASSFAASLALSSEQAKWFNAREARRA